MSVYLVGAIDIEDEEGYALYRNGVSQALAPFNVEILSIDGAPLVLEGQAPAHHLFIIRFASEDDLKRFFASERYQGIIRHRHRSSATRFLIGMRSLDVPDAG